MKWTESFTVNTHDTDPSGMIRTGALLKYMQETANLQCRGVGPSNEELRKRGFGFVVSRMALSIYKDIKAYDVISVSSWPCESRGFTFNRCYEVKINGELAAEVSSAWALMNLETRRPCRVTEMAEGYLSGEYFPPVELDVPIRIRLPEESSIMLSGEYTVSYRDADVNRHMNNTVYADMLCGFLPMDGKKVISFSISYQNEAPLGENLKVYTSVSADGTCYLKTVREDGKTNVEAEILLEDI